MKVIVAVIILKKHAPMNLIRFAGWEVSVFMGHSPIIATSRPENALHWAEEYAKIPPRAILERHAHRNALAVHVCGWANVLEITRRVILTIPIIAMEVRTAVVNLPAGNALADPMMAMFVSRRITATVPASRRLALQGVGIVLADFHLILVPEEFIII